MDTGQEPGSDRAGEAGVRPLEPYAPEGGAVDVPTSGGRSRRKVAIASGISVVLFVAGVAGAAWVRNQFGSAVGAAEAVPVDADLILTVDFLHFIEDDRLSSVAGAITRPLVDVGTIENGDLDSLIDELDSRLADETGLSLRDDVVPWVGRTASVSMLDLEALASLDGMAQPSGLLVTVEVRDQEGAESFLKKVVDLMEEDGASVSTTTVDGHTVYAEQGVSETTYYSLVPDMLVIASDEATLRSSFSALGGRSILDSPGFQTATATLDADRGWTLYIANVFAGLLEDAVGDQGIPIETDVLGDLRSGLDNVVGFTGAGGLLADGAWAEFNVVFDGEVPAGWNVGMPDLTDLLPANTYFYLAGRADPDSFGGMVDAVRDGVESAGIELGPYADVLGYLDGGFTIGVVPAKSGFVASNLGADVGLILAAGLDDAAGMRAFIDGFLQGFVGVGGLEATVDGDMTRVFADGAELLAYAVTDDALVVASSGATLDPAIHAGPSVTDGDLYRDLDAQLPGDGVMVYADVSAMLDAFVPDEAEVQREAAALRALRGFGASTAVVGHSASMRVVLLLETSASGQGG